MTNFERQIAKYIFAKEVKNSILEHLIENDDSQYVSKHIITPTGQESGRVFMCGTLTELEDIGTDTPYFKARLVDPTGAITIYTGEYQPEATKVLEDIEAPAHIAVIGKISLYTPDDNVTISSIRAENIAQIDEDTIRTWTFMAARNLVTHMESDSIAIEPKKMALEKYGNVSEEYKKMIIDVLSSLLPITNEDTEPKGDTNDR